MKSWERKIESLKRMTETNGCTPAEAKAALAALRRIRHTQIDWLEFLTIKIKWLEQTTRPRMRTIEGPGGKKFQIQVWLSHEDQLSIIRQFLAVHPITTEEAMYRAILLKRQMERNSRG